MKKDYRMMQFEQIINNIESCISIAEEIEINDYRQCQIEALLSDLKNEYDDFVNCVEDVA